MEGCVEERLVVTKHMVGKLRVALGRHAAC
jgi:hypothetical protein